MRQLAEVRPRVLARGCEFSAYVPMPNFGWPRCRGPLVVHHAAGRKLQDANHEDNLRCLCSAHHDYVTAHGKWAISVGLSISRLV